MLPNAFLAISVCALNSINTLATSGYNFLNDGLIFNFFKLLANTKSVLLIALIKAIASSISSLSKYVLLIAC